MLTSSFNDFHPEDFKHIGDNVQIYPPVLFLNPGAINIGDSVRIDSFTRIEGGKGVRIGHHTHISSFSSIYAGGEAFIGNFVGIAQGARIITGQGFPFERDFPALFAITDLYFRATSRVIIGDFGVVGSNAVVLPGVTLGEGAVLASGSVATENIPDWCVYAGSPARWVRARAKPEPRR